MHWVAIGWVEWNALTACGLVHAGYDRLRLTPLLRAGLCNELSRQAFENRSTILLPPASKIREAIIMDRRFFLKTGGIGLASFGLMAAAPEFLHQFAGAATLAGGGAKKKILVTIFQRGAVDGLNMVVPHGEGEYYNLRPTIAVPKPGKTDGAIDLDGFFGLESDNEAARGVLEVETACGRPRCGLAGQHSVAF